jgi:hypothetical protein
MMKSQWIVMLVFGAFIVFFCSESFARTWYIKLDGTGDAPTIQAGIDSSSAGDVVLVAPGTYDENILIDSPHNGITVISESGAELTIIAAANPGTVVDFVGVDYTTRLQGFTLTGGTGAPNPEDPGTYHGGGIRIFYCSPTILENIVIDNHVDPGRGGGIQCFSSAAIIEDNIITENSASFHGGGIHVEHGSPVIIGNTISYNTTPGGGAVTAYYSTIEISENHFMCNNAGINGGAIVVDHCDVTIERNLIHNNTSQSIGGGIFLFACSGILSSNTVVLNTAGISGGLAFLGGSAPQVQNNIVARNTSQQSGGIGCDEITAPCFSCNDVWNNTPDNYGAQCGDQTGLSGNISNDPEFCGILGSDNYYLQSDSPCAPGNHPDGWQCGLIGLLPVGCGPISAKETTWSELKRKFQ